MKLSERLKGSEQAIIDIVEANNGCNPRIFGSVARGEDREDSDLDLVIDRSGRITLTNLGRMSYDIQELLGCKIDILIFEDLEKKELIDEINKDVKELWKLKSKS